MLESNRREFLSALLGGAAGLSFTVPILSRTAAAQAPTAPPIVATKLTDTITMLAGNGGNVALVAGADGLFLIDAGLQNREPELLKAIADVDRRRVAVLFNTHWHFDHVGANEALGQAGTRILAHENVKKRLSETVVSDAFGRTFEPLAPQGPPTEIFATGGRLTFGRESIEYTHIPNAHTDGDGYVFLPSANVLHTGDLGWNGLYPVIDYSTGGWIGGMVTALDRLLGVGDDRTQVIPGHGPLGTKADLKTSRDMLSTVQGRLTLFAQQGRTLEEVIAQQPTRDLDEKWGAARRDGFIRQAYNSLLKRR